jgi:hypothetical protein
MDLNKPKFFSLSDLKDATISPTLWYRLHVLVFDLQHFNQRADSKERLESVIDPSYIGTRYFNPEEAVAIKNTTIKENMKGRQTLSPVIEEELQSRLDRRIEKRINTGDFRVCTAHDLAPVIGSMLRIDFKRLEKSEQFLNLLNTRGLNSGGEDWKGLPAKSIDPKKRKKTGKREH